jgi:hypothetical protein
MRKIHKLTAVLLSGLFIAVCGQKPAAADVAFEGSGGWRFDGVSVQGGLRDLFAGAAKDMLPGGRSEFDILLVNNTADAAEFILLADALTLGDASDRALLRAAESANPGKTADDGLLERVRAEVTRGGTEIYSGTLGGTPAVGADGALYSPDGAYLGAVAPGASALVHVALTVDRALENEYADALCAVSWQFAARAQTEDGSGANSGNGMGGNGNGDQGDITVTADPPETGDDGSPLLFTLLAGLSLAALAAALLCRAAVRRRENGR